MSQETTDEELVSAADAARILDAPRKRIKNYEDRGLLVPARITWQGEQRKPMFRRADVEALRRPSKPEL